MTVIKHPVDVSAKRAAAYPLVPDQLDAAWKILQALPVELLKDAPADALAVMQQVKEVKERFVLEPSVDAAPTKRP